MSRASPRTIAAESLIFQLSEGFARISKGVDAGRYAAIYGDLEQNFLDFVLGQPVLQRALDVQLQFMGPVERAQHCQIDDRAGAAVEPRPCPQGAPAKLGRPLRHCSCELIGPGDRLVDVVLAKHLLAHLEAFFEQWAVAHDQSLPMVRSRTSRRRRGSTPQDFRRPPADSRA